MADIEITDAMRWEFELAKEIYDLLNNKSYIVDFQPDVGNWLDKYEKCRPLVELVKRERLAAFAAGQEKERADVVAWLNTCNEPNSVAEEIVRDAADAIARGEHKEN